MTLKFCRGQSTVQETQRLPDSEEEQRLQDRDHPLPLSPEGDPQEGGHHPGGRWEYHHLLQQVQVGRLNASENERVCYKDDTLEKQIAW